MWRLIFAPMAGLLTRLAELETRSAALEARPKMEYRGVWNADTEYHEGNFATDHGSVWYCRRSTRDRPGTSENWTLAVKKGAAAK